MRVFRFCRTAILLARLQCAAKFPRNLRAVWTASRLSLAVNVPSQASSTIRVSGPTASRAKACSFARSLSLALVAGDTLALRTLSKWGDVMNARFGAPNLSRSWRRVAFASGVEKGCLRKDSVLSEMGNSLVPMASCSDSPSSLGATSRSSCMDSSILSCSSILSAQDRLLKESFARRGFWALRAASGVEVSVF